MLNTKFDLYETEWLDLVFTDRNKEYGAYELRKNYSSTMVHAMGHTFGIIGFFCTFAYIMAQYTPIQDVTKLTKVTLPDNPPIIEMPKKSVEPAKPLKSEAQPKQLAPVTTSKFVVMKPTNDPVTEEPKRNVELGENIGPIESKGSGTVGPIDPQPVTSSGGDGVAAEDVSIHDFKSLEAMPEPIGGFDAFSKFLGRTLRFPAQAQDAGVSGRVIVSFVIEKNGELSNVTIEKGAGYGFDQEAARVLKLAKAWKPGKQNGQSVRVRYQIPINFQLPSE